MRTSMLPKWATCGQVCCPNGPRYVIQTIMLSIKTKWTGCFFSVSLVRKSLSAPRSPLHSISASQSFFKCLSAPRSPLHYAQSPQNHAGAIPQVLAKLLKQHQLKIRRAHGLATSSHHGDGHFGGTRGPLEQSNRKNRGAMFP
jgi:hypothetical protein